MKASDRQFIRGSVNQKTSTKNKSRVSPQAVHKKPPDPANQTKERPIRKPVLEFGVFPKFANCTDFCEFSLFFSRKTLRIHQNTPNSRTGLRIGLSLVWFAVLCFGLPGRLLIHCLAGHCHCRKCGNNRLSSAHASQCFCMFELPVFSLSLFTWGFLATVNALTPLHAHLPNLPSTHGGSNLPALVAHEAAIGDTTAIGPCSAIARGQLELRYPPSTPYGSPFSDGSAPN